MVSTQIPTPLADAPQALIDLILRKDRDTPPPRDDNSPGRRAGVRDEAVRRYVLAALDRQVRAVETAGGGFRNQALNNAALSLGHLVGAGALGEAMVRAALEDAAASVGLVKDDGIRSVRQTISSGLRKGISEPTDLSKIGRKPQRARRDPPTSDLPPAIGPDLGPADGVPPGGQGRPVIQVIGGKLPEIVDAAEAALLMSRPNIYRYGGQLVRPVVEEVPAADETKTRLHRLAPITSPHLTEAFTACAAWQKFSKRDKEWIAIDCPDKISEVYMARAEWKASPLVGIINAPMLRADGSLLNQPGYDARTGLIYYPDGVNFPNIPERAAWNDARKALNLLREPLRTFPFVGKNPEKPEDVCANEAVALSAMLTALDRRAVETAPMHGFSAPVAGSGKTKLVDICSMLATGQRAPVIDQSKDDNEFDKRLVAALLRGGAIISIDNVSRPLDSALLCQALTSSGMLQLRVLGHSRDSDVPNTAMFFCNGNNLTLAGDLTRRSLVAQLDPAHERPETRKFDSDPVQMVRRKRATYVAAALTIMKAYMVSGTRVECDPLGSYETWSRRAREALLWLGCDDPCETIRETRRMDPVAAALLNLILAWKEAVGLDKALPARSLIDVGNLFDTDSSGDGGYRHPDFRDALYDVAGDRRDIDARRLGKWLKVNEGRVIQGLKIARDSTKTNVVHWMVTTSA